MKKRCVVGKSCGASCISRAKVCLIDLSTSGLEEIRKLVRSDSQSSSLQGSKDNLSPVDKQVKKVYDNLNSLGKEGVNSYNGDMNADSINWKSGMEPTSNKVGSGSFASFVEVPPENLAKGLGGKFPDGVGIKYGKILEGEVEMLKLLGENGLGPRLIAAKVSKSRESEMSGIPPKPSYLGMVAMAKVPGRTITKIIEEDSPSKAEKNKLRDSSIEAFSRLHRLGVAHGDADARNIVIGPNGKATFIDLGNSRRNWTHALAEAVGLISGETSPFINEYNDNRLMGTLRSNWENRVFPYLKSQGVNRILTGLLESWSNVPDQVAIQAVKELYHGIP